MKKGAQEGSGTLPPQEEERSCGPKIDVGYLEHCAQSAHGHEVFHVPEGHPAAIHNGCGFREVMINLLSAVAG